MRIALWLLSVQGIVGAFDTLYYHEWRARLVARGQAAASELKIHAARDFLYAILFGTLPWLAWQGGFAVILSLVILAEIALTLWDFVIEISVRKSLGGVYAGERLTHAIMGMLYGAFLANLTPILFLWWSAPSAIALLPAPIPDSLRWWLL